MAIELIDTTLGEGDSGKAGGDKINAATLELASRSRSFYRRVASRAISGKHQLVPLSNAGLTHSNVSCSATGYTQQVRVAAPAKFNAIRVLIPNVADVPVTGIKVGIARCIASGGWLANMPGMGGNIGAQVAHNPNNDVTDQQGVGQWLANSGAYLWGSMLFGDGTKMEVDLPPANDPRGDKMLPSWTATDWTPFTPAERTDGGVLPLVDLRIQYPPVGYAPASGAAPSAPGVTLTAQGFANWAIDGALPAEASRNFNGGLVWKCWSEPDQGVNRGVNFQGSNNPLTTSLCIPIIVQFATDDEVVTMLYANDSIGEINDGGERGNSYAFRGAMAAAAEAGVAMSWCPMTWPSGSIVAYGRESAQIIDLVRPSVLWIKPIGPNETTTTPLAQRHFDAAMNNLQFCARIAEQYGSRLVIEPHLAVRAGGPYTWAASDSFRRDWNAQFAFECGRRGFVFANLDPALIAGGVVLNGQTQPFAAATDDGVHLAEPGHEALKLPSKAAALEAIELL